MDSLKFRRQLLYVIAAFFVTLTRHLVQYGHPPWFAGLLSLLASWFVHYIALIIIAVIVAAAQSAYGGLFEESDSEKEILQLFDGVLLTLSLAAIVTSLFILLLREWVPIDDFE